MDLTKEAVATQEAGHALVVLATPLREHIAHARVYYGNGKWRGDVGLDDRDRESLDPHTVFEFAKNLAGPMAQLRMYPDSIPEDLKNIINNSDGVLDAARRVVREKLNIRSNWGTDLADWIGFCRNMNIPVEDAAFIEIEKVLDWFFRDPIASHIVLSLADRLTTEERLNRTQLLKISTAGSQHYRSQNDCSKPCVASEASLSASDISPSKCRKLRSRHPAAIKLSKQCLALLRWRTNATGLVNLQNL